LLGKCVQELAHDLNAIGTIPLVELLNVNRVAFVSANIAFMPKNRRSFGWDGS